MERDQPTARLEVHESKESDARQSAHSSTMSRRSRSSFRKISQIQEAVLRQEATAQRSQDTLDNMTAMIRWQVNMQFRKDREADIARNPNPDPEVLAPQNQPEVPRNQPAAYLPEQQMVLPNKIRRMDPHPFPPLPKGRRGRGGANPLANNDRNRSGANWRIFHILKKKVQAFWKFIVRSSLHLLSNKLKTKCRIPIEERHFIQMTQAALKISLRKRFDGILFADLAELANKASKYEDLLKEEQQKRNSSKGTYYKTPSSSVHLVEVESEEDQEDYAETEIVMAEMA
ncbi:PREDICTED: Retrotransposon gag, partial [Prunus dulcis]